MRVRVILNTSVGTVILYRLFGDWRGRRRALLALFAVRCRRFFTQAWNGAQHPSSHESQATQQKITTQLHALRASVPDRLLSYLDAAIRDVHFLFHDGYPQVLCHGDLNQTNMMVDPETGTPTGVIDWASATVGPFGLCANGLYDLLGTMNSKGWHFHRHAATLEKSFWAAFSQHAHGLRPAHVPKIHTALIIALLTGHGFVWDDDLQERRPIIAQDECRSSGMRYLDALLAHVQTSVSMLQSCL